MADANIINLIVSTINTLQATSKYYEVVKDDNGLREAFHEAGRGVYLVGQALESANSQLINRQNLIGDSQRAMNPLESCNTRARLSENVFKIVAEAPETARQERYKAAVTQEGKGNTVEVLVKAMMCDICELVQRSAIEAVMKDQVKGLRDAIEKLSMMKPSVPNEEPGHIFANYGSGSQYNTPWGTQNITTGNGNQFPGATFSGSVTFSGNPS